MSPSAALMGVVLILEAVRRPPSSSLSLSLPHTHTHISTTTKHLIDPCDHFFLSLHVGELSLRVCILLLELDLGLFEHIILGHPLFF